MKIIRTGLVDTFLKLMGFRNSSARVLNEEVTFRSTSEESAGDEQPRLLLQIFSANLLEPLFFEFIQRKDDEGFGEGNFKALFESIERDQMARGVIGDP